MHRGYSLLVKSFMAVLLLWTGQLFAQTLETEVDRETIIDGCLLYTSPSPRDGLLSRMPSSA